MRSGVSSISWDVIPMAHLYFGYSGTIDTTQYYGFEFWVYGGGNWNAPVDAQLVLPGGQVSLPVHVTTVLPAGIQAWTWSRVVFPFETFSLGESTTIIGMVLNSTGTNFEGTIYVDDVRLIQKYPICANSTMYIYNDKLENHFIDWSWGGSYSLSSSNPVYSGQSAISWELYNNDGIKFHTTNPVDTTKWQAVSMYLNYQQLQGWQVTISLTSNGNLVGTMGLLDYYAGSFPPGNPWVKFVVPFYEFGIHLCKITAL